MLDVRIPIGWMFLILGALLIVYGYVDPHTVVIEMTKDRHFVTNLNVECGWPMFCFGMAMLMLYQADQLKSARKSVSENDLNAD